MDEADILNTNLDVATEQFGTTILTRATIQKMFLLVNIKVLKIINIQSLITHHRQINKVQ